MKKRIHSKEIISLTFIITLTALVLYPGFEPLVANALEDQFTIKQTVTGEIALATSASDVVMSPSIPGLTGGTANGSTYIKVTTSNNSGYSVTLKASTSDGMLGDTYGGTIPAYTPTDPDLPDFDWSVGANTGEFGYTVEASTTADLAAAFKDNSLNTCGGANTADTVDSCWYNASSTQYTIINRSSHTAIAGEQTTIKFRAQITANPNPIIPEDTYTATTTLTISMNP